MATADEFSNAAWTESGGVFKGYAAAGWLVDSRVDIAHVFEIVFWMKDRVTEMQASMGTMDAKLNAMTQMLEDFGAAAGIDPVELAKKIDAAVAAVVNRTKLQA